MCRVCPTPEDPVVLLSLLKHPLFRAGQPVKELRKEVRTLEKKMLRERDYYESGVLRALQPLVMTGKILVHFS